MVNIVKKRKNNVTSNIVRILVAILPMICYAICHLIAGMFGRPYTIQGGMGFDDVGAPDAFAVNWFINWEIIGVVLCFVLAVALMVVYIRRFMKSDRSKKSAIDLFGGLLLLGEAVILVLMMVNVCNPIMAQNNYRWLYCVDLLTVGNMELPIGILSRWREWVIFGALVVPVALVASMAWWAVSSKKRKA